MMVHDEASVRLDYKIPHLAHVSVTFKTDEEGTAYEKAKARLARERSRWEVTGVKAWVVI